MNKPNVVQINNAYVNDESLRKRYEEEETRKRHRFMGWILICMMLLFILPTYNLVSTYEKLEKRRVEIKKLEQRYQSLVLETDAQKLLAKRLKDSDYIEKYARAKYYYSQTGEIIYPVPDLLAK